MGTTSAAAAGMLPSVMCCCCLLLGDVTLLLLQHPTCCKSRCGFSLLDVSLSHLTMSVCLLTCPLTCSPTNLLTCQAHHLITRLVFLIFPALCCLLPLRRCGAFPGRCDS